MSVSIIIYLIRDLHKHYKVDKTLLLQNRKYLDKAFGHIFNYSHPNNEELLEAIKSIDENFFSIFQEDPKVIRAFILSWLRSFKKASKT